MKVTRETLDALEFSVVRELLAERTLTPMGRPLALRLEPLPTGEEIASALDETDEALRLIDPEGAEGAKGGVPLRGIEPVDEIFATLRLEGSVLTGREILTAARFCEVVEGARAFGRRVRSAFPGFGGRAAALPALLPITAAILGKIAPGGELDDSASPALARIRARIHAATAALHATLESILARQDADKFLSDAFITERRGRFVIPVRSDSPVPLRGVVHGGSSSGATVFVEPLATVEMNNEIVRLRDEEIAETEKILRAWTETLRGRLEDLLFAAGELASLDVVQAKGHLARDLRCARPSLEEGGAFTLASARHPLLEKTLAASGGQMVAVDIGLPAGTSTLIVSGPNAGGKTVVLKTAGLLAAMAHAGLFVPAREARLPLFRQILVDIGDRQSIEGSLSTFSAHIKNLSEMARALDPPCLVLIDEIGTGTDPAEGVALATALLAWLRAHGAVTIATTHHGPVKIYGIETPGVASAAVEFDEKTLSPTFRLLAGIAGASSGLAIAERLGLDPRIIADARSRVEPGAREAEEYLRKLRDLVGSVEEDRRELDGLRARLQAEGRRAREEAIRSDHERAEAFRGELSRALEEFRAKARTHLQGLEERQEAIRFDKERSRREAELRRELEKIARRAEPREPLPEKSKPGRKPAPARPAPAGDPLVLKPGDEVLIGPYARAGKVESIEADRVTVLVGTARFRVRPEDCSAPEGGERIAPRARWSSVSRASGRGGLEKEAAPTEINLIGLTVEEGVERLDKFLDDAALAAHPAVRVIHGHGTGRLRKAVRDCLASHALVSSHRPGAPNEGGDGATVAVLKE